MSMPGRKAAKCDFDVTIVETAFPGHAVNNLPRAGHIEERREMKRMLYIASRYVGEKKVTDRQLRDTPVSSPRIDEILARVLSRRP